MPAAPPEVSAPSAPPIADAPPPKAAPAAPAKPAKPMNPRRRARISVILAFVFVLAVVLGAIFYAHLSSFEETDDAFIDAHITAIAPKVAGRVAAVLIDDNKDVKKGDLLIEIDPGDFDAQIAQRRAAVVFAQANETSAQAGYEQSLAHLKTLQATVEQEEAGVVAGNAQADLAAADLARVQELFKKKVNTPADFDKAAATAKSYRAIAELTAKRVNGARSQLAEGEQSVAAAKAKVDTAHAQITQAEADLRLAELNGSYARLTAPEDGRVTRKAVEPGSYVQVGQSLFSLVSREVWVTANFKENQLARMRPGQPAEIAIDAIPGRTFRARVDSIQSGSGARFSLLPPENATGNYIKVVQRVPVKLTFLDPPQSDLRLGPGVSVVPSVDIGAFHYSGRALVLLALISTAGFGLILFLGLRRPSGAKASAPRP